MTSEEQERASESTKATAEAEIRALIDDWAKAMRAKDVDGVMSHYPAGSVTFDLARSVCARFGLTGGSRISTNWRRSTLDGSYRAAVDLAPQARWTE